MKFPALREMTKFMSETPGLEIVKRYRFVLGAAGTKEMRDLGDSRSLGLLEWSSFPFTVG